MKIEHRIAAFLKHVIEEVEPDIIVPVERKGTAILRALIDNLEDAPLCWQWSKVISSAVISSVATHRLEGRRILIFDELLRHGRRVKQTINRLLSKGVARGDIITAVFAVHQDCRRELDHFAFSQIDDDWYETFRQEIVEMLQRHGSLLLDTEHVEVLIRIEGNLKQFVDMLSRCGERISVFRSGVDRLNITVDRPRLCHPERVARLLPDGCDIQGIVNKCRIVRTNNPSEFALIPIYFADTPQQASDEWYDGIPRFLRPDERTPQSLFYTVGLLTALEVLGSMISMLRGFDNAPIIECPRFVPSVNNDRPGRSSAPLNHLLAMYPYIEGVALEQHVAAIMLEALPARPRKSRCEVVDLLDRDLDQSVRKVAAMVVTETDRTLARLAESPELMESHSLGLPNRLLYQFAEKRLDISRPITSAAIDRLIDEAYLVTKVERTHGSGVDSLWGRTFEPDGEIASSRIRRFIAKSAISFE